MKEVDKGQLPDDLREQVEAMMNAMGGEAVFGGVRAVSVPDGINLDEVPGWALMLSERMEGIIDALRPLRAIRYAMEAKALVTPGHREALNYIYARNRYDNEANAETGWELVRALEALDATGMTTGITEMIEPLREATEELFGPRPATPLDEWASRNELDCDGE